MSNNVIKLGNLDMLRSMYDFQATYSKTLSFRTNDYFILHQTVTKHKNWWEVINEKGAMGFIPSNYVEKITVSPTFYIQYLENCIDHVRKNEGDSETIARLKEMKRNIEQLPQSNINAIGSEGGDNIPPLLFKNSEGKLETLRGSSVKSETSQCAIDETTIPESLKQVNSKSIVDNVDCDDETPAITATAVYELVDSIRVNTQLSYRLSRAAVATVIHGLHDLLPASVFPYLSTIQTLLEGAAASSAAVAAASAFVAGSGAGTPSTAVGGKVIDGIGAGDGIIGVDSGVTMGLQTHDANRLQVIFDELTSCKQDEQQRSWMLHEDEPVIMDYLNELISILTNADAAISKHMISSNQYSALVTLTEYYQMETRWSIRQLLLQAFGVMCGLDSTVISICLNSVLPCEIARDMQANEGFISKLSYSALLLTMVFSSGEPMPVTHQNLIGVDFISFLLRLIEEPPDADEDEQIADLFLNLILGINLQFSNENIWDNPVISALSTQSSAKTFTEKSLLLLNRDEDPVRIFDHEPEPPHAVLKLFVDVFSTEQTSHLFYTNDVRVLTDITVRNMLDLSSRDQRRHQYIILCRLILRNTNYNEHCHRIDDIIKCFNRIFCEDCAESELDQKLLKDISQEFPQHFQ